MSKRPIRIANVSGFYGDRMVAMRDMLAGPDPVDVLTGDYLAELTMLILWKARRKDESAGYATTFLRQMEQCLGECLDHGVRVVVNAGGLNPRGLQSRLQQLADNLGLSPRIAVVEGDDVLSKIPALQAAGETLAHLDTQQPLADADITPLTANAYLGGFGIAAALAANADVVITPRVTDAALVIGPAAWWHGWTPADYDPLAGAVVAGHVIECGPQCTGGNYSQTHELPDMRYPGFPIAEVAADGSSVITKQPGTGGAVTIGTVTAQLLYEIAEPAYANPDVTARFDTITLGQAGQDRVAIGGVRGEPPPDQLKVAINYSGGWRNAMALVVRGLDKDAKATRAIAMLGEILGGWEKFRQVDIRRIDDEVRVTVKDADRDQVGRRFSGAVMELMLASYAGAYATTPPTDPVEYGVYWPTLIPKSAVEHTVTLPDGSTTIVPHAIPIAAQAVTISHSEAPIPAGPTMTAPLGSICGGRSGDKGGNANVGIWTTTDVAYAWLEDFLTIQRFRGLLPEAADLEIRRFELPNLRALNFVILGLLGEGVASSVRPDPQAKSLAEQIRAQTVPIPVTLIA